MQIWRRIGHAPQLGRDEFTILLRGRRMECFDQRIAHVVSFQVRKQRYADAAARAARQGRRRPGQVHRVETILRRIVFDFREAECQFAAAGSKLRPVAFRAADLAKPLQAGTRRRTTPELNGRLLGRDEDAERADFSRQHLVGHAVAIAIDAGTDDLDGLLQTLPLPKLTDKTITDRRTLRRELDEVRRTRIAYDNCELDDEVRCVAVAVQDFAGRCVGAMGLSGPVWRLSPQTMQEKSEALRGAAAELSAQLGFEDAATAD